MRGVSGSWIGSRPQGARTAKDEAAWIRACQVPPATLRAGKKCLSRGNWVMHMACTLDAPQWLAMVDEVRRRECILDSL